MLQDWDADGKLGCVRVAQHPPETAIGINLQRVIRSVLLRPMHSLWRWLRRTITVFLCLLAAGWLCEEAAQWLLRWQGKRLLAEVKSLQVGGSSANVETLVSSWSKRGTVESGCQGEHQQTCYYFVTIRHLLPSAFRGDPDRPHRYWIAGLIDHTGLRSSAIGAGIQTENGVISQKSFSEDVDLPVRDWYLRGGAYVPTLTVSSTEKSDFRNFWWREQVNAQHPFRYAHRFKGPYGVNVSFTVNEAADKREKLLDFRFSCITTYLPCRNEREILEEGTRLLESED